MSTMLDFARLTEEVRRHFNDAPDGCHDFDHTLRVLHNAEMLLDFFPEAESCVVRVGALLHDIGRVGDTDAEGGCHAERGAAMAESWLRARSCSEEFIGRVVAAVRTHRYRSEAMPESIEAKIVFDADKLDSVGLVGVTRALLFAGRIGARLHNTEAEALAGAPYSREDTAYREYLVKLRHIPERMMTEPGRAMASSRTAIMAQFFTELERELL